MYVLSRICNFQEELIESEKQRVRTRLKAHYDNDTWEQREHPPEDWDNELPEDIIKNYEGSYLQIKAEELKTGQTLVKDEEYLFSDLRCSIM